LPIATALPFLTCDPAPIATAPGPAVAATVFPSPTATLEAASACELLPTAVAFTPAADAPTPAASALTPVAPSLL
jgi:hypothetical protein